MKTWTCDRILLHTVAVVFLGVAIFIAIMVPAIAGTRYHYEGPTLLSVEDAMPLANSRGYHNLVTLEATDNGILLHYDFTSGKAREEPILAVLEYTSYHSSSEVWLSYVGVCVIALGGLVVGREAIIRTDECLANRGKS